jgi:CDP-diacylglycerol--glycerol-3-phosphate 3-phosphatidyltransferase
MEDWARKRLSPLLEPLIDLAARAGLSPSALTLAGFGLNALAGLLIALGWPFWGGVMMAGLAMPLDALDGGVARKLGRQSAFGAFLDSTLDRCAEGALLAGLGYAFALRGDALSVAGTFLALAGSFMVSYTRARAEGLGLACRVGVFSRLGRFVLLAVGLLSSPLWPASLVVMVWALAFLTSFTTLERVLFVYRLTRGAR